MNEDIGQILENWPFDPENSIRKVIDSSGIEKIQVRVDQGAFQGVLQMNLDGRPDGRKPHGEAFAFDFFEESHQKVVEKNGSTEAFQLSEDECQELFDESQRIYKRYVFLLQIQDYKRVVRDTEQNMELFRFVNAYAEREEDRGNLEKWWPYIIRIHATALASQLADDEKFERALKILSASRQRIETLDPVDAEEFHAERERSVEALDELAHQISGRKPLSARQQIEKKLEEAITDEAFEQAAQLRDQLRDLPDAE